MAGTDMSAAAQAALILRYTLDGNPAGKVSMKGGAVVLCVQCHMPTYCPRATCC